MTGGAKRILVLTLSFGAGHVRAAESVAAELACRMPEAEIKTIDALRSCSLVFRAFYVWTYFALIRYAPQLWKRFFESRVRRRDEQTAPVRAWMSGCRKVFKEIETFQPDAIAACEVGASEIAVIARRKGLSNAAVVNVVTDFEAEPIWVKPEVSAYAAATETVKNQLVGWGADEEKIKVCGIPLGASFAARHDAEKIKTKFGFDADARPMVLLMGGGMGPTRMDEVAKNLLESGANLQIVALAGKDRRARRKLEALRESATVGLRVYGWTENVAALMQSASVLATKPGGLTLSEAAACGVPIILFGAIPGPEAANARHFIERGAATLKNSSAETTAEVLRLLANRETRERMAANCRKLARPKASAEIANLIAEVVNARSSAEQIFSPCERLLNYIKMSVAWREASSRQSGNSAGKETEKVGARFKKSIAETGIE